MKIQNLIGREYLRGTTELQLYSAWLNHKKNNKKHSKPIVKKQSKIEPEKVQVTTGWKPFYI